MKTLYILLIAILTSCSLFKKTTKSTTNDVKELRGITQAASITENTIGSYSKLFTFRKDGSLYQYQYVKDTANEVKVQTIKIAEQQIETHKAVVKKSEPAKFWIYAGLVLLLLGAAIIFWKR